MKWLLTVAADTDVAALAAELSAVGASLTGEDTIPLGQDEKVVYVEAPPDLVSRLRKAGITVRRVNPSSEFGLHLATGPV